ncbi:MAG: FecR domain-containing protein [Pseudohongiellaceae bacterium]
MNDQRKPTNVSEQRIAEILTAIGPRPKASEEMAAEVKANVKKIWHEEVEQRKNHKNYGRWFAAAASLVVAVSAIFFLPQNENPEVFASLIQNTGIIEYRNKTQQWSLLSSDQALSPGTELRSGNASYGSLDLSNGMTLRMDQNTRLSFEALDRIYLATGGIYAESHSELDEQSITIETQWGSARDIGTRFEVRADADQWRVQVRDGLVVVNQNTITNTLAANERLVIDKNDQVTKETVSAADQSWHWTQHAPSLFNMEGANLKDFINWWSRETGRVVHFRNTEDLSSSEKTILHGSLEGVSVTDSLEVVLATTRFEIIDSDSNQVILARSLSD